jgi:ABC-2 type transport system ATP-binding protein
LELRREGTTVVFSTHDMDVAEEMCDTIFMIFNGKKVLDGTLDTIQQEYAADRVRVRLADPSASLPHVDGVVNTERVNEFWEFQMAHPGDAPRVIRSLASQAELTHFEVVRPTLHEIFVRIARPEAAALAS